MAVASTSSGSGAPNFVCRLPWMNRLLKECEAEGEFEAKWPIIMLELEPARIAMWYMCSDLGVGEHGVPGQACRMLEMYLARYVLQNLHLQADAVAWISFKQTLTSRFILLMATCIRLATKMSTSCLQMNADKIRTYLQSKSVIYSQRQVCSAEIEVYQMLSFTIPLWTSVEVGMMLAKTILKMSSSSLAGVGAVVNFCELHRNYIHQELNWVEGTERSLRTLHLTAGAVLASGQVFGEGRREHLVKMAAHTCINQNYLRSLVNILSILIESLKQAPENPTPAKKRKIN